MDIISDYFALMLSFFFILYTVCRSTDLKSFDCLFTS